MSKPKIIVAINYVNYSDPRKKQLQERAMDIIDRSAPDNVELISINYPEDVVNTPARWRVFSNLQHNSAKLIGNNRPLPYIFEILDVCSKLKSADIFGYINSDIILNEEFFNVFSKDVGAYIFYKRDIEEVNYDTLKGGKFRVVWDLPDGQDGFFFNRKWWNKNRKIFPRELILGETEWDTCYNSILQNMFKDDIIMRRSLYHVYHDRAWTLHSPGALNNINIWDKVQDSCGLPPYTPETFHDKS